MILHHEINKNRFVFYLNLKFISVKVFERLLIRRRYGRLLVSRFQYSAPVIEEISFANPIKLGHLLAYPCQITCHKLVEQILYRLVHGHIRPLIKIGVLHPVLVGRIVHKLIRTVHVKRAIVWRQIFCLLATIVATTCRPVRDVFPYSTRRHKNGHLRNIIIHNRVGHDRVRKNDDRSMIGQLVKRVMLVEFS